MKPLTYQRTFLKGIVDSFSDNDSCYCLPKSPYFQGKVAIGETLIVSSFETFYPELLSHLYTDKDGNLVDVYKPNTYCLHLNEIDGWDVNITLTNCEVIYETVELNY